MLTEGNILEMLVKFVYCVVLQWQPSWSLKQWHGMFASSWEDKQGTNSVTTCLGNNSSNSAPSVKGRPRTLCKSLGKDLNPQPYESVAKLQPVGTWLQQPSSSCHGCACDQWPPALQIHISVKTCKIFVWFHSSTQNTGPFIGERTRWMLIPESAQSCGPTALVQVPLGNADTVPGAAVYKLGSAVLSGLFQRLYSSGKYFF